jgi:GDP-4-dehydro-6-deoxy-D-mannose reductase
LKDVLRQKTSRKPLRALVTGAAGFAGSHLTGFLIQDGFETYGTDLSERSLRALPDAVRKAQLVACDVRDREGIGRIVSGVAPDVVFHLAGVASVLQCERNPTLTIETNIVGSCNLLDAVRDNTPEARTIVVSSSEVYGKVMPEQLPLGEDAPVKPANFYGVTKASVELLSKLYVTRYGMDVVILRPFNHIGARQSPAFVCADFASQIAKMERGLIPPRMDVGDLTVERDFTDVKDMVRGYVLAARRGRSGETYNLCSGTGHRIEEVLNTLLGHAKVPIEVHHDPAKLRGSEIPVLVGTADKVARETGWYPEIPLETTLRDILDYWRAELASASSVEGSAQAT